MQIEKLHNGRTATVRPAKTNEDDVLGDEVTYGSDRRANTIRREQMNG